MNTQHQHFEHQAGGIMTITTSQTPLRYGDYYSMMSLKDFTEFAAAVEAGAADRDSYNISAGAK